VEVLCDGTASVASIPDIVERAPGDVVPIFVVVEVASDTMVDGLRGVTVLELVREVTATIIALLLERFSDEEVDLVSRVVSAVPRPAGSGMVLVSFTVELLAGVPVVLEEIASSGREESFVDLLDRLERASII